MWRRASRSRGRTERPLLARNRFDPSLTVRRPTLVVNVTRPSTEGVALNAHTNTPLRLTLSERFERDRSASTISSGSGAGAGVAGAAGWDGFDTGGGDCATAQRSADIGPEDHWLVACTR